MSAVVRLLPKDLSDEERALSPFLNKITTTAFAARRKTIRNSLGPLFEAEELVALGIDLDKRAEDLPLDVFVSLAKALQAKRSLSDLEQEEHSEAQDKQQKRLQKLQATSPENLENLAKEEDNPTSIKALKAAAAKKKKGNKRRSHKFDDFDFNDINADL